MYAIDGGSGKWAGRECPGSRRARPDAYLELQGLRPESRPESGRSERGSKSSPQSWQVTSAGAFFDGRKGLRASGRRARGAQAPPQRGQRAGSVAGAGPGGEDGGLAEPLIPCTVPWPGAAGNPFSRASRAGADAEGRVEVGGGAQV